MFYCLLTYLQRKRLCVLSTRLRIRASETVSTISPVSVDGQTFVIGASWDKLIRCWGQKVSGQGHVIAADD